jgi:hypothetical protein
MEHPEGAAPEVDGRNVRPRFDDPPNVRPRINDLLQRDLPDNDYPMPAIDHRNVPYVPQGSQYREVSSSDALGIEPTALYDTRLGTLAPAGSDVLVHPTSDDQNGRNLLPNHPNLQPIYLLHPIHRHMLRVMLAWEFQRLSNNSGDRGPSLALLKDNIEHLFFLLSPVLRAPQEIQEEILLCSILSSGNSPLQLMKVCKLWRATITNISRLWSSLKLGAWTAHEQIASKLERSREWPLEVEINTVDDVKDDSGSQQRYRALAAAIPTMPRWKTLKLVQFSTNEDTGAIQDEVGLVSQFTTSLSRLESFTMLDLCNSSAFVKKLLSVISTSTGHLKMVQLPCPTLVSHLTGQSDHKHGVFRNLTTLRVQMAAPSRERGTAQEHDILPHLTSIEVLELSSMLLKDHPVETTIPLTQTLRQLNLRATSIDWMLGRTLHKLQSCSIVFPPRLKDESIRRGEAGFPSCREMTYNGHPIDIFLRCPPATISTLRLGGRGSGWDEARVGPQINWLYSTLSRGGPKLLEDLCIDVIAPCKFFTKSLPHLSSLRKLTLRMAKPSGLSRRVLEKLLATPRNYSETEAQMDLFSWASQKCQWSAPLCPHLKIIQLEYMRWLRPDEQADVVPLFTAIAWTRTKLNPPLQSFQILVGEQPPEETPLELVGEPRAPLRAFTLNGECGYEQWDETLEATITSMVFRKAEIHTIDTIRILSQPPYRSVLRRLRSLKLHCSSACSTPLDLLSHLELLEDFDARGLLIPPYSHDTNLKLVGTLKRMILEHTSILWMAGRRFAKLEVCKIWSPISETPTQVRLIEMPVCDTMAFGDRTVEGLTMFHLPALRTLELANPWFPDPDFTLRWTNGVEIACAANKVKALHLEVGLCHRALMNTLVFQSKLEELGLRFWGWDGLESFLEGFITGSSRTVKEKYDMDGAGSGGDVAMKDDTVEGIPILCPQLQTLEMKMSYMDYENDGRALLPICERILQSRAASGQPLRSFKVSWGFGEEVELVP